jgi:hypothetical protein
MRTLKRLFIPLLLTATLCFVSLGFACSKSEKDQNVAFARDVVNSLNDARPLIVQLRPQIAARYDQAINSAGRLVTAIENSNQTEAIGLLTDLIPVVSDVAAQFTNNTKVLTVLALANIGLHFLVNHIHTAEGAATARRSASASRDVVFEFDAQPVWGCDYKPEKCKGLRFAPAH